MLLNRKIDDNVFSLLLLEFFTERPLYLHITSKKPPYYLFLLKPPTMTVNIKTTVMTLILLLFFDWFTLTKIPGALHEGEDHTNRSKHIFLWLLFTKKRTPYMIALAHFFLFLPCNHHALQPFTPLSTSLSLSTSNNQLKHSSPPFPFVHLPFSFNH